MAIWTGVYNHGNEMLFSIELKLKSPHLQKPNRRMMILILMEPTPTKMKENRGPVKSMGHQEPVKEMMAQIQGCQIYLISSLTRSSSFMGRLIIRRGDC